MSKRKEIMLDCGVKATQSFSGKTEFLDVSLMDLYSGYGELNNFSKLQELFKELESKGFKGTGLSRQTGYYDSTDDLILNVMK